MREEQASADSRFSRYVGHTGGGLFCISPLPCLFLCCLPRSRLHLISYSLTPFISGYLSVSSFTSFFVFWQTSVTVTHSRGRSGEQEKRVEREIKSERSCQWRQHFFTGFPVSFSPCWVLSKVCQWSFCLQFLQHMLSTVPPLFSCHLSLPSNHLHISES